MYLNIDQQYNNMQKTYRDPTSGKIYTESGEYIPDLMEYTRRVRAGEISGQPLDIKQMPSVIRTADGGIASKQSIADKLSSTDRFKSNTKFLQAAQDIIKRKQEISQPLSESKAYWRTLQRDTSPFGGLRDEALNIPGTFTDKDLRLLSPSEQASVRSARDAASEAHLQGISEQEKYREGTLSDTITAMKDLLEEKDKIAQQAISDEERKLDIIKKKQDLGMPITDEDYKGAGLIS